MRKGSSKVTDEMALRAAQAMRSGKTLKEAAQTIGVTPLTLQRNLKARGWRLGRAQPVYVPYRMFVSAGQDLGVNL